MSLLKMEFDDADSVDAQLDAAIDIIDEKGLVCREDSPTAEYVLSGSEDNIVAYRIVHMPDETSLKQNSSHHQQQQSIQNATQVINGATVTTASGQPQHLQYIVIDGANGFLQIQPTNQISTVQSTPIKIEANTNNSVGTLSSLLTSSSSPSSSVPTMSKMRTSIAIAPKIESAYLSAATYNTTATNNTHKSNISHIDPMGTFKKRDDRRRATHNEVERRRRDKINHWIMKLGNIIPADGSAMEIGTTGRPTIAAIEGQSKGGILSKACEYVQMLQEKQQAKSTGSASEMNDNQAVLEKKKYEDEIARLRGENELLKAILIKNGINYAKERTSIKFNEFS